MSETPEAAVLRELLTQLVEQGKEARKPAEIKAARIAKMKMQLRSEQAEMTANRKARQAKCTHLRSDNSSVIAWAQFSDGSWKGVCQHCDRLISQSDRDYAALRKIPCFNLAQTAAMVR